MRMKLRSSTVCLLTLATALSFALSAYSQLGVKTFRNSYIEFEIPAAWDCQKEDIAFVCQEANRQTVDMIAVLTAKMVDPKRDNSAVYASQLAQAREWKNSNGTVTISSEIRSGTRCYDGRLWQWAHHYESELQNYYTDYFVRIEGDIAALVTVSYHRSVEAEGSSIAATLARRLRMIGGPSEQGPQSSAEC
jgi:hypothetical protein